VLFLPGAARSPEGFPPNAATLLRVRDLGPVKLTQVRAPTGHEDPARGYIDPGDAFVFAFVAGGAVEIAGTAGLRVVRAGELGVTYTPRLQGMRMTSDFRAVSLRIDHTALPLADPEIDVLEDHPFSLEESVPRLLATMATQLVSAERVLGRASEGAFVQSVMDLVTGFTDDLLHRGSDSETARRSLVAEARRRIRLHLACVSFGPASLADDLGVSVRTLHKAFEQEAETVATAILEARLDRAKVLLARSGYPLSIETVAQRCGFASASAFSRAFSRTVGVAPRDWRRVEHRLPEPLSA
jgi:AraC-like DNA-binding protein